MSRARDSQKTRLYEAERKAALSLGVDWYSQPQIPNGEVQAWVDKAMDTRAIRSRWGSVHITVTLKSNGSAYGYSEQNRISLPPWARNPWVICHELAHVLHQRSPGTRDQASHGAEYAGVYLFLVGALIGDDARKALLAAMREKKVKRSTSAIPAVRTEVPPTRDQAERARKQARLNETVSLGDMKRAAEILRRAVHQGMYGGVGTKPRAHAQATARVLEAKVEQMEARRAKWLRAARTW